MGGGQAVVSRRKCAGRMGAPDADDVESSARIARDHRGGRPIPPVTTLSADDGFETPSIVEPELDPDQEVIGVDVDREAHQAFALSRAVAAAF